MTPDVKNTESPAQYLVCSSNVPILLRRNQKKHQQQQQPEAIFGKSPHVPSTNQPVSDTAVVNSPVINIIDEKRIPNRYAAKRYTASPSETPPKKPCLPQIEPTANGWYFFSVNRMRVWIWYHVRCVLSNWMLDGHGGPDCEQRIALSPVECSASTYFGGQIMLSPNRFHRKNRSLFYYRTIQCKQWNFNKKNEYCLSVHVIFIIKIYTLFYQFRIAIEFEYVVDFFQFYHSLKFDYQQRIAIAKSQSTESPQKSPLLFLLSCIQFASPILILLYNDSTIRMDTDGFQQMCWFNSVFNLDSVSNATSPPNKFIVYAFSGVILRLAFTEAA